MVPHANCGTCVAEVKSPPGVAIPKQRFPPAVALAAFNRLLLLNKVHSETRSRCPEANMAYD
jgi:hypothetical protein